jgi:hypothetical protein|tara:strand:+ start:247 stop:627 length:381 start_codon:yes stop_codon:yes gene_type:complete
MTITNETTIQTLIDLGVITDLNILLWNIKADRIQANAEKAKIVTGTKSAIMEVMNAEFNSDTKFFSVKTTSNSVGFMSFIETDRATVLKALTLLVAEDKIKKVGVVGGEVKLPTEVNAFQIRYMRA